MKYVYKYSYLTSDMIQTMKHGFVVAELFPDAWKVAGDKIHPLRVLQVEELGELTEAVTQ